MGRPSETAPENASFEDSRCFRVVLRPKNPLPQLQPQYTLDQFPSTIGRHPTNDIELPFDSVSRFHARIEIEGSRLRIVDLHSSNGTMVNGKRVQLSPLLDQDLLTLGGIELSFTFDETPGRGRARETDPATSVHFVAENEQVVESCVEADIPEDTSSVPLIAESISDSEKLRHAKDRLITFYRLQELLRSTTDEKKLLRRALSLVFQVLPVDRGVILTRDREDNTLFNPIAVKTREDNKDKSKSIGISKTILKRCLKEKIAILTRDAESDERFNEAESIQLHRIRSAMCVPLISYHHVFGFIHLDTTNSVRVFNEDDLAFLTNVGVQVALHLHNLRMLNDRIVSERMAAIGQTITGLAHNIKNVVLLSQGGMELMEKRLAEKSYDSIGETWTLVKRGIDRINSMVKDMLDYSRARTVEKSRCDVNELVTEIRETFTEELDKRRIVCKLDLDPDCPVIMADSDGLDKAIVNLLLNATEACSPDSGAITLRTRFSSAGSLRIEVQDNAGGIPNEVLPRIFFPFFTTKGSQGTGLGLAMTKKFVEDMGGRIEVETREGEGSLFTIHIAIDPADVRIESAPPAVASLESTQI